MKPHGLLLLGGRSSRMGQDKALLRHPDGRALWQRGVALLSACCDQVYLSLRHDQDTAFLREAFSTASILRDEAGNSDGPIAGLLAAFRCAPASRWLVMSCDLPRVDEATLRHLIRSHHQDEPFLAYRSEFDGRPEPLCAIYAPAAHHLFQKSNERQICCPRKILIQHQCRLLEPITLRALENTNTPLEWEIAQQ